MRAIVVVPVLLAFALLHPAIARAEAEDEAAAEMLFAEARSLMREGKLAEACRKFSESYRLDHAGGALLNLALCHEKEGKIASAWVEYKESVTEARRAGRPEREQVALESAAALEPRLPKLTVTVPPEARVSGLEVIRNQSAIEQGGWGTPLPVDPGEVSIEVRAPGHKPWSTKISIQPGETQAVSVPVLEIDEATLVKPPWWTTRKKVAVSVGAVGVTALGVGAFFGIEALANRRQALNGCPTLDGELRCSTSAASVSQTSVRQAWVSDVAVGAGVLGVAAAVYLIATDKPKASTSPDAAPAPATARVDLVSMGLLGAGVRATW